MRHAFTQPRRNGQNDTLAAHTVKQNAPEGHLLPLFGAESPPTLKEQIARGRGALTNATGRFERQTTHGFDDGWESSGLDGDHVQSIATRVTEDFTRSILARNTSPDIPFDRSINVYRGCEHGCVYCFARPTHTYLGHSAGLDFETELYAKPNAAALLRREISRTGYQPRPIAMGTNTDPYQPIEADRKLTRACLEVLAEANHPVTIVTKSRLVVRDLDILAPMAEKGLVKVALSLTTLDHRLSRAMEPRAASPQRRLDAIRLLSEAGVPTSVLLAPIIPAVNDTEIETLLAAAAHAGASEAAYILLRLPLEVKDLFAEWLTVHLPNRKDRVLARLKAMRGGERLNDPRFGHRMRGAGPEGTLLRQRFQACARRLGLKASGRADRIILNCDDFVPPSKDDRQLSLL